MRSIFDPLIPAGAYDEFTKTAVPASRRQPAWTPADGPLPVIYNARPAQAEGRPDRERSLGAGPADAERAGGGDTAGV
jgi:hypothetical protein